MTAAPAPPRPADRGGSIWAAGGDGAAPWAEVRLFAEALRAAGPWLALWLALCLGGAVLFIRSSSAEYVATTRILLEPRWLGPAVVERDGPGRRITLDDVQSRTQLAIMRSPAVLRRVFDALAIADSPDVAVQRDDLWTKLRRSVRDRYSIDQTAARRYRAFDRFSERLLVRRMSSSYVFEFTYRSLSAEQAVRVADAAASAYILSRIETSIAQAQVGAFALTGSVAEVLKETEIARDAVAAGRPIVADLPDAGVRPLGPATVPFVPVSPRPALILVMTACFSIVAGLLAVMVAGLFRQTLNSRLQVRLTFGVDCLCIRTAGRARAGGRSRPGCMSLDQALPILRATLGAEGLLGGRKAIGIVSWTPSASCGVIAGRLHGLLAASGIPATLVGAATELIGSGAPRPKNAAVGDLRLAALELLRHPRDEIVSELDGVFLVFEAGRSTLRQARAAIAAVQARGGVLRAVLLVDGPLSNSAVG